MASVPLTGGLAYKGVGRRFVATLIDGVIGFIVGYVIALLTGGTTEAGFDLSGAPAFLLFLLGAAYFILCEAYLGGTVGKLALGMRVVKLDGSPCDLRASLIRNVLRIVDALPFLYIVGLVLVLTSDKKQRLGDRVAGTVVVGKR